MFIVMESSVFSSPDHHLELNIEEGYLDISINESDLELFPKNEKLKSYVLKGTTDASGNILKLLSDEEINNFILQKYCNIGSAFNDKDNLVNQYMDVKAMPPKKKHARRISFTPISSAKRRTKPPAQSKRSIKIPSPPRDSVKNEALHRIFNKKKKSSEMLKSDFSKINFAQTNPKTVFPCPAADYNRLMMTSSKLPPQLERREANFKIPKKQTVEYKAVDSLSTSLEKMVLERSDSSLNLSSSSSCLSSSTSTSGSSNSKCSCSSFKQDEE